MKTVSENTNEMRDLAVQIMKDNYRAARGLATGRTALGEGGTVARTCANPRGACMTAPAKPQPKTDAIIEGVRMSGTMLEYRERQLIALEVFAGEQERDLAQLVEDRARLVAALEGLSAMGVLDARGSDSHESAQRRADACALLRELEGK